MEKHVRQLPLTTVQISWKNLYFTKIVVCFYFFLSVGFAQVTKNPINSSQIKSNEIVQKMNALSYSDLQNTMVELNQVRSSLDEHLDFMAKSCQILADKNKEQECLIEVRATLKKLWTSYFGHKEKYLNFLHQHYLSENQKQTKITLDFIDSLQSSKSRR